MDIDGNSYGKIHKMSPGNVTKTLMKLSWTKKAKVPIFNQTSCQQQEEQRKTSTWPSRCAAGKNCK